MSVSEFVFVLIERRGERGRGEEKKFLEISSRSLCKIKR